MKKEELGIVIEKANEIFKELMGKYGGMNGYLVFSSPRGQCEITSDLTKILKEFPEMIAAESKNNELKDDTFIEVRFSRPNLDTIFAMQSDPLVSQKDTPQTRASVRIVLGTLSELSRSS